MKTINTIRSTSLSILFFSLSILFLTAGCANMPIVPSVIEPNLPEPITVNQLTSAQPFLDCVAGETTLKASSDAGMKIMPGPLKNNAGNAVGSVPLPPNLKSNAFSSFARFDYGIELYDSGDLTGIHPNYYLGAAGNFPYQTRTTVPAQLANVDYVLDGSLTAAQVARSVNTDIEIAMLGGGARAELYDISMQLYFKTPQDQRLVLRPMTASVRVIIAENGISGFYTSGQTYSRLKVAYTDHSPALYAVQFLTDTMIGVLVSELNSIPKSRCGHLAPEDFGRAIGEQTPLVRTASVQIQYNEKKAKLCAMIPKSIALNHANDSLTIRWRQYRKSGIEILPRLKSIIPRQTLMTSRGQDICMPANELHVNSASAEIEIENHLGTVLATGRFN